MGFNDSSVTSRHPCTAAQLFVEKGSLGITPGLEIKWESFDAYLPQSLDLSSSHLARGPCQSPDAGRELGNTQLLQKKEKLRVSNSLMTASRSLREHYDMSVV